MKIEERPLDSFVDIEAGVIVTREGVDEIDDLVSETSSRLSGVAKNLGSKIIKVINFVDGFGDPARKHYEPTPRTSTLVGGACLSIVGAATAYKIGPEFMEFVASSPEHIHNAIDEIIGPIDSISRYRP